MSRSSDKFCLQWNSFRENTSSTFAQLREDKNFTDVTLVCEDGQQVKAHKFVLASSSSFFNALLKKNIHPHPLIYMRGLRLEDILAMMDFIYSTLWGPHNHRVSQQMFINKSHNQNQIQTLRVRFQKYLLMHQ